MLLRMPEMSGAGWVENQNDVMMIRIMKDLPGKAWAIIMDYSDGVIN